jgi:hypothetical protein
LKFPTLSFAWRSPLRQERGIPLGEFVTEAVRVKLTTAAKTVGKALLAAFSKLRHLRKETARINRIIEQEFEQIEFEDRQCERTLSSGRGWPGDRISI